MFSPRAIAIVSFAVGLGWSDAASAQRLPGGVVPKHYTLQFAPDLVAATFSGTARIDVDVAAPTASLTLHSLKLTLSDVGIIQGNVTRKATVALHPDRQQAELSLANPLAAGPATITIAFSGVLNKQLTGLYLGTKDERRYAATQLEATEARRMFPSFDEPALKATFDVSAIIDQKLMAISNGRQISDVPGPAAGTHTVTFATTPRMSTYLVALLVGEFECASGLAGDIPLRVCALPGQQPMTAFALEATKGVLDFYSKYYEIKYPFGKLDQIAIPDFSAGAMENSGAIVYRELLLLVDPANATTEQQQLVAQVIAHEIAHQWFGNLVTMAWWDDLWLSEGFASWMEAKALDAWKPEWRMSESVSLGYPFFVDSSAHTRPIHAAAETPDEISQLFDGIAYQKTAAVLRMIERYVGAANFRRGVNAYLAKHQYGNATANDFAAALAAASNQPVDRTIRDFVEQPGLPLLTISARCDGQQTRVDVTQRRFFYDAARLEGASSERWAVPVCLRAGDDAPTCRIVADASETIDLPGCHQPVFGNDKSYGYYRTAYSPESASLIARAPTVSDSERALFLGDQSALVTAGRMDIGAFLDLIDAQRPTPGRLVLQDVYYTLRRVHRTLASPSDRESFERWARTLVSRPLAELGLTTRPSDTDEQKKYRTIVVKFAVEVARDPDVIARLTGLATAYMAGEKSVDPALVDPAFTAVTQAGDPAMYDRFTALAANAANPLDRDRYVSSLAAFENEALVRRTLEYAISEQSRAQDVAGYLFSAFNNPAGTRIAWAFLKQHYEALVAKAGLVLGAGIVGVAGAACEPDLITDMEAYFVAKKVPGAERVLQDGLERARLCVHVKEQQQPSLHRWLSTRATQSK